MAKNIVVLIDGTGNEVEVDESNVLRLARLILNQPGKQIFYYDPGVGTQGAPPTDFASRQELLKMMGLGIGAGVFDKVASGYHYLVETYEPGDRLYFFGFSRGAYIARALAGIVSKIGILESGRDNLVTFAVKLYADPRNLKLAQSFSDTFCDRKAEIHFLGLWDTVKSVFRFEPILRRLTSVVLPRTFSNEDVRCVRQALAIDERRRFFRTNLWNSGGASTDVKQVWFAGVHSDIGGGYPASQSGLALITLAWMLREAMGKGLFVDLAKQGAISLSAISPLEPIHSSLGGWWWVPEWFPKRGRVGPTSKPREGFYLPRGERRFIPAGAYIHQSVIDRINANSGYAPTNLPTNFQIEPY